MDKIDKDFKKRGESLISLMDRPIAFQRAFVRLGAGITGALMLSQAVYWAGRTRNQDGWFYKDQQEWEEETGLTRREQEKARRALRSIGVLEEVRKGVPARLYYRVNTAEIEKALLGERRAPSLEEVLTLYASTLSGLSKAGRMRAAKLGVEVEHVDYAKVLKQKGMTCGICGQAITLGPGRDGDALAFDHIRPLSEGGSHCFENLQPAHVRCNSAKACQSADDKQPEIDDGNEIKSADGKQTGLLTDDNLGGLRSTGKTDDGKHAITETTAETTAESTPQPLTPGGKPPVVQGDLVEPEPQEEPPRPRCEIPADMPGPKDPNCKTYRAWANYAMAYRKRYDTWPIWNAKNAGHIGQLINRVGAEQAPRVAAFFLCINDAFYVRRLHPLSQLVADCESVATQMNTNRQMTGTQARQADQTQGNLSNLEEAKRLMREMRERERRAASES